MNKYNVVIVNVDYDDGGTKGMETWERNAIKNGMRSDYYIV
jgi:hypothetical protein